MVATLLSLRWASLRHNLRRSPLELVRNIPGALRSGFPTDTPDGTAER